LQATAVQNFERIATYTVDPNVLGAVEAHYMANEDMYRVLNANTQLLQVSPVLQNTYDSLSYTNIATFYRVDSLLGAADTASAVSLNQSIFPLNVIEVNHKTVNTIYFNMIYAISDSSATGGTAHCLNHQCCHTLRSVAEQCPYLGGSSVYRARVLLSLNDTLIRYYADTCLNFVGDTIPIRQSFTAKPVISEKATYQLYPNPANDQVNVEYQVPMEECATLEIYAASGTKIIEYRLQGESGLKEISTQTWAEGVYLFRFSCGNQIHTQKLVISR
jgi:hypothetical protein